jgi:hypothetical protein
MKSAAFPEVTATVPRPAGNALHRTTKKHTRAPERSAGSGAHLPRVPAARPAPHPMDATFATAEAEPIDAPMWPLHTALWLQPETAPSIPVWTGLAVERHNRIPAPDFLYCDTVPPNRPGTPDKSDDALRPAARREELPQSGLAPLGWDPRAVGRKPGGE